MLKVYEIIDIQHSGKKAPRGVSKVGDKYDRRRGRKFTLDLDICEIGKPLLFAPILYTTPYVNSWEDKKRVYIETENSIYVCKVDYIPTEKEASSIAWFRQVFYYGV